MKLLAQSLKSLLERTKLSLDKLLIIGSTGLVGSKLAFAAAGHGFEPYNTQNARKSPFPNSTRLNITDRDATLRLVGEIRPKVIVNTAALTNVDYCETHKEEAEKVNVGGVRNLVEAALINDCRFIQISTDSVFENNEKVRAVRDQYSSPTLADNLAEALLRLAKSHENGVFHTAGRSCVSRQEFVIKLAQVFGYPTSLVEPVFASEFQQVAPRPKNCCLRVDKAERSLGMRFLTAEEGIRQMRRQPQPQGDSSDRLC